MHLVLGPGQLQQGLRISDIPASSQHCVAPCNLLASIQHQKQNEKKLPPYTVSEMPPKTM